MYRYLTRGTCSRAIDIELSEDGQTVESVSFMGGCNGNLKAIAKIAQGMAIDDLARVWEGNTCGPKPTSCADQLVRGLREAQAAQGAR